MDIFDRINCELISNNSNRNLSLGLNGISIVLAIVLLSIGVSIDYTPDLNPEVVKSDINIVHLTMATMIFASLELFLPILGIFVVLIQRMVCLYCFIPFIMMFSLGEIIMLGYMARLISVNEKGLKLCEKNDNVCAESRDLAGKLQICAGMFTIFIIIHLVMACSGFQMTHGVRREETERKYHATRKRKQRSPKPDENQNYIIEEPVDPPVPPVAPELQEELKVPNKFPNRSKSTKAYTQVVLRDDLARCPSFRSYQHTVPLNDLDGENQERHGLPTNIDKRPITPAKLKTRYPKRKNESLSNENNEYTDGFADVVIETKPSDITQENPESLVENKVVEDQFRVGSDSSAQNLKEVPDITVKRSNDALKEESRFIHPQSHNLTPISEQAKAENDAKFGSSKKDRGGVYSFIGDCIGVIQSASVHDQSVQDEDNLSENTCTNQERTSVKDSIQPSTGETVRKNPDFMDTKNIKKQARIYKSFNNRKKSDSSYKSKANVSDSHLVCQKDNYVDSTNGYKFPRENQKEEKHQQMPYLELSTNPPMQLTKMPEKYIASSKFHNENMNESQVDTDLDLIDIPVSYGDPCRCDTPIALSDVELGAKREIKGLAPTSKEIDDLKQNLFNELNVIKPKDKVTKVQRNPHNTIPRYFDKTTKSSNQKTVDLARSKSIGECTSISKTQDIGNDTDGIGSNFTMSHKRGDVHVVTTKDGQYSELSTESKSNTILDSAQLDTEQNEGKSSKLKLMSMYNILPGVKLSPYYNPSSDISWRETIMRDSSGLSSYVKSDGTSFDDVSSSRDMFDSITVGSYWRETAPDQSISSIEATHIHSRSLRNDFKQLAHSMSSLPEMNESSSMNLSVSKDRSGHDSSLEAPENSFGRSLLRKSVVDPALVERMMLFDKFPSVNDIATTCDKNPETTSQCSKPTSPGVNEITSTKEEYKTPPPSQDHDDFVSPFKRSSCAKRGPSTKSSLRDISDLDVPKFDYDEALDTCLQQMMILATELDSNTTPEDGYEERAIDVSKPLRSRFTSQDSVTSMSSAGSLKKTNDPNSSRFSGDSIIV